MRRATPTWFRVFSGAVAGMTYGSMVVSAYTGEWAWTAYFAAFTLIDGWFACGGPQAPVSWWTRKHLLRHLHRRKRLEWMVACPACGEPVEWWSEFLRPVDALDKIAGALPKRHRCAAQRTWK